MRWSAAILAVGVCAGLAAAAAAGPGPDAAPPAAPGALSGGELYAQRTCVACHGKDAKTPILPEYPKLAGQSSPYLLRQMLDIKSGARSNGNTAAMKGVMFIATDEELETIADWLATLP